MSAWLISLSSEVTRSTALPRYVFRVRSSVELVSSVSRNLNSFTASWYSPSFSLISSSSTERASKELCCHLQVAAMADAHPVGLEMSPTASRPVVGSIRSVRFYPTRVYWLISPVLKQTVQPRPQQTHHRYTQRLAQCLAQRSHQA